jgi:hypothetical protein
MRHFGFGENNEQAFCVSHAGAVKPEIVIVILRFRQSLFKGEVVTAATNVDAQDTTATLKGATICGLVTLAALQSVGALEERSELRVSSKDTI